MTLIKVFTAVVALVERHEPFCSKVDFPFSPTVLLFHHWNNLTQKAKSAEGLEERHICAFERAGLEFCVVAGMRVAVCEPYAEDAT